MAVDCGLAVVGEEQSGAGRVLLMHAIVHAADVQDRDGTFAWLGRCRRLAKDWECLNHKALAFLRLASIRLMLRKLCNPA